ncbi:lipoprotein 17-related variable surface protein [Metamycoplasma salivarium]|uniref:lipoprotein 17-related variable surface protein n=1 Tax=Metamycoplasma salivarium TaxID=2124 RepID=UPI001F2E6CC5|nr:lipoprotein 17-related variable surface protein [Metamycoplasma salivarium]GIZ06642.1 hypothetical protein MSATCC23557_6140 [Metamycoplasma salivarium]
MSIAVFPLLTISCKQKIDNIARNLEFKETQNKENILATNITKNMIKPKNLDSSYTFQIDGDLIADKEKGEITFSYYLVDTKGNKSQTYKKTISGFKKEENPLPIDPNDENSRITKFAIELEAYLDVNNENIVPIFMKFGL